MNRRCCVPSLDLSRIPKPVNVFELKQTCAHCGKEYPMVIRPELGEEKHSCSGMLTGSICIPLPFGPIQAAVAA